MKIKRLLLYGLLRSVGGVVVYLSVAASVVVSVHSRVLLCRFRINLSFDRVFLVRFCGVFVCASRSTFEAAFLDDNVAIFDNGPPNTIIHFVMFNFSTLWHRITMLDHFLLPYSIMNWTNTIIRFGISDISDIHSVFGTQYLMVFVLTCLLIDRYG